MVVNFKYRKLMMVEKKKKRKFNCIKTTEEKLGVHSHPGETVQQAQAVESPGPAEAAPS